VIRRTIPILFLAALALALLGGASAAQAATGPLYAIKARWGDTNLPPGGEGQFTIQARNIGDATGSAALTIAGPWLVAEAPWLHPMIAALCTTPPY
jgi:hypothetical protein